MKRDDGGISIGDLSFCKHQAATSLMDRQQASSLLACAISMRVDIYKIVQPEDSEDAPDEIKPSSQIFKFKEITTSVEFRPDGNLLLVGETSGHIQLFET